MPGGEKKPPEECPFKECVHHGECAIIEITGKAPKPDRKCSYFDTGRSGRTRKAPGKEGDNGEE